MTVRRAASPYDRTDPKRRAARAASHHEDRPTSVSQEMNATLRLQAMVGNRATGRLLAPLAAGKAAAHVVRRQAAARPALRTALDSKIRVQPGADARSYNIDLDHGNATRLVGRYRLVLDTPTRRRPVHIEDFIDSSTKDGTILITYAAGYAVVDVPRPLLRVGGKKIWIETRRVPLDQLEIAQARVPRHNRSERGETIVDHMGAGDIDKAIAPVAAAEGGFATTQTYDAGVLSWGQGQWTAHAGSLQRALRFIRYRRPDLWAWYFGDLQLDVEDRDRPRFIHRGRTIATNTARMSALFRPDAATSRRWVEAFAQFGMDPEVQRLQREYLRHEARGELARTHAGNRPADWLNARAQSMFFSMKVNHPATAYRYFRQAVQAQGGAAVNDALRRAASDDLEDRFRHSGIRAFQKATGTDVDSGDYVTIPRHHTLGFWGTGGRDQGVADCDSAIGEFQAGVRIVTVGGIRVRDPWSVAQWRQHRRNLERRQTRYEKTAEAVRRVLNAGVEPDIPAEFAFTRAANYRLLERIRADQRMRQGPFF